MSDWRRTLLIVTQFALKGASLFVLPMRAGARPTISVIDSSWVQWDRLLQIDFAHDNLMGVQASKF